MGRGPNWFSGSMDLSYTTEVVCFRFSSYLNRSFLRPLWRLPSGKQNFITCRKLILFSLVDPLPTPPSLHSRQRQRYRIHRTPFSTSTPTHGNLKHNNNCKESASKLGNWENAFIFWTNPTSHPRSSKTMLQREARRHPQLLRWFRPFYAINCTVNYTTKVSPNGTCFSRFSA